MNRRSALRRLGGLAAGAVLSTLPSIPRAGQAALTSVREASGWLAITGQRGEVVIRISPRFLIEHPAEALALMTRGRLP